MKLATICSGIGSPEKALKNIGIDYELSYFCEFDKYAVKSYCAIHNEPESKNIGDLTTVDIDSLEKNLDLIVGGTPCQDFSLAGKRKGGEIDSNTRSSLMWNFVEIIRVSQPKAILWENVMGALTIDNKANYDKFVTVLASMGYKISAFTMNSKYYGIPQNRARIFVLGSKTHTIRKPQGYDCGIRIKDVLESEVDEKYYLSSEQVKNIKTSNYAQNIKRIQEKDFCDTQWARDYKDPKCVKVADLNIPGRHESACRVYSPLGIAPICNTCGGGGLETKILCLNEYDENNIQRHQHERVYDIDGVMTTLSAEMNGRFNINVIGNYNKSGHDASRIVDNLGIAPTVKENHGTVTATNTIDYKIRKLTPLECFRLMGFSDIDFNLAQKVNSNSQLYKQAGNSIVTTVLMAIFGDYYGIEWKAKVYGKWHKTGQEQFNDLPIMEELR